MRSLSERAVFVSLVPLVLALAALGVREATRERAGVAASVGHATEFAPPALFLAASASTGVEERLSAVPDRSSARVASLGGVGRHFEQPLRVAGTVRILADETLAELVLDLAPRDRARGSGWARDLVLHLRGVRAPSRTTAVPGVRAASMRCSATLAGVARETNLAVTWTRLPGGTVELHAVAPLDRAPFDLPEPWWRRMLPRGPQRYAIGVDVVLRAEI